MFLGLAEAAEMTDMNKKKLAVYRKRKNFDFPRPMQELASGPIWAIEQTQHYNAYKKRNMRAFYNDGTAIWELFYNQPMKKYEKSINEFIEELSCSTKPMSYFVLHKEQVEMAKKCLQNPSASNILGPGAIAAHYNYGLITNQEFNTYMKSIKKREPSFLTANEASELIRKQTLEGK